ncbi:MAG: ribbon-helix-helix protein, CopG family [Chloroflexi bacterium]|nr:ribbon-helix-helix protein, CopG family [Chloroflexota bacterium]
MRTTVTLEPDVAARIREIARERRISFKSAINEAIRAGFEATSPRVPHRYRETTRDLGVRPGIDLTKALALAADLEDEQAMRELELRK